MENEKNEKEEEEKKETTEEASNPVEETSNPTEEASSPTEQASSPTEEASSPTEETSSPTEEAQENESTEDAWDEEAKERFETAVFTLATFAAVFAVYMYIVYSLSSPPTVLDQV